LLPWLPFSLPALAVRPIALLTTACHIAKSIIVRYLGAVVEAGKAQEAGGSQSGCRFRTRCPVTMEFCAAGPPLFRLDAHHTAGCFLHDAQPSIARERLSGLLPA
jgi:ABC-type dipeptide/oligopeptide/nickel transport system ATPase component